MHGPRDQFRVSGSKVDTDTLTPLRLPQKTRSKDQVKSKARLHTSGFFFLHLQHHNHIPAQQLSQLEVSLPRSNSLRCMFSNSLCSAHNSFRSVSLSFPLSPPPLALASAITLVFHFACVSEAPMLTTSGVKHTAAPGFSCPV